MISRFPSPVGIQIGRIIPIDIPIDIPIQILGVGQRPENWQLGRGVLHLGYRSPHQTPPNSDPRSCRSFEKLGLGPELSTPDTDTPTFSARLSVVVLLLLTVAFFGFEQGVRNRLRFGEGSNL